MLAISDEDAAKVRPFIAERRVTYPILLDPGRKVNALFQVEGIPKRSSTTARASWPHNPSTCGPGSSSLKCSRKQGSGSHREDREAGDRTRPRKYNFCGNGRPSRAKSNRMADRADSSLLWPAAATSDDTKIPFGAGRLEGF